MPSAVEFQRLADELRQVENAIIQAASFSGFYQGDALQPRPHFARNDGEREAA